MEHTQDIEVEIKLFLDSVVLGKVVGHRTISCLGSADPTGSVAREFQKTPLPPVIDPLTILGVGGTLILSVIHVSSNT